MGNLLDYLLALWQNWVWFVTGGPFLADRLARQLWSGYDAWVERFASQSTRTRITLGLAILGFLVANYLAFSVEHNRAERLAGMPAIHRHVGPSEAAAIKEHFAGAASLIPEIPICTVSDPEAEKYAQDFWDAFHDAHMNPHIHANCSAINDNDRGIFVGLRDNDHPSAQASEFMKRFLAAGFQIKETRMRERDTPLAIDFDLFIALPERE